MHYTRIYSDENGDTHFEDIEVQLYDKGSAGRLSIPLKVNELMFRENKADYNWDFHTAPAKQFIILLDGIIEVTTSLGKSRQFSAGEILLVEDTTGKGHKTKNITTSIRKSLFITL